MSLKNVEDAAWKMINGEKMIYNRSMTATVYIFNEDKVLLHRHKKYKSLFPVGGHIEETELPEEAAKREIREETGIESFDFIDAACDLELQRGQILTPFFMLYENIGEDENVDFIFAARTNVWELSPQDGESNEFYWMTKEEIDSDGQIIPHIKNVVTSLFSQIKNK